MQECTHVDLGATSSMSSWTQLQVGLQFFLVMIITAESVCSYIVMSKPVYTEQLIHTEAIQYETLCQYIQPCMECWFPHLMQRLAYITEITSMEEWTDIRAINLFVMVQWIHVNVRPSIHYKDIVTQTNYSMRLNSFSVYFSPLNGLLRNSKQVC